MREVRVRGSGRSHDAALLMTFFVTAAFVGACGSSGDGGADDGGGSVRDASFAMDAGDRPDAANGSGGDAGEATPQDASGSDDTGAGDAGASDAGAQQDASGADAGERRTGDDAGGPVYGYCTKPCGTVADCCPAGAVDCPSTSYPNNYMCIAGACRPAVCHTNADCMRVDGATSCLMIGGEPQCAIACVDDGPCRLPLTCSGTADDGRSFCLARGGTGCSDDTSCGGFGRCVDRVCVCASRLDCTRPGFTACAL